MAKVLVIGGAGYVGSAACAWLLDRGHAVWVLDDLSTGRKDLVLASGFVRGRAGDRRLVAKLLKQERFDCVMHFAARSLVAESVRKPREYFENNVVQTEMLLEEMLAAGVRRFIFSSTCAVFGDTGMARIHEKLPKKPINPYGETKLKVEEMLERFARDHGLQAIALRYFNAAGAEPGLRVGEWHEPETHLIPKVLQAAARGEPVEIFGTDYPTPDGTCIRDYIHVTDLAEAHESAMLRLMKAPAGVFEAFNLGSANGFSVKEVVAACEKGIGHPIQKAEKPRRAGDPPQLVADSAHAKAELGFEPKRDLAEIVRSAWAWERKRSEWGKAHPWKAVFLDRDGTINEDPGYLSDPKQLKLLDGVGEALAALKKAGYELIVVSNQSGVGRGLIEPGMLPKIHDRLHELLKPWSVEIDRYELCFHRPEDRCECRKPKPKLILDAAQAMKVDLGKSYMIGDKRSDIFAGLEAGCRASILVRTGNGRDTEKELNTEAPSAARFIGDSLLEAARWILDQETAAS